MNILKQLFVTFLFVILLCGCNVGAPEDYMRPPSVSGKYKGLVEALKSSVGSDIILKFPRSGNNLSTIVDIGDENGGEKAVVFYRSNQDNSTVSFNLLCKEQGEWVSVSDFEGSSADIDSVEAVDLDSDGLDEMVISWQLTGENNIQLAVFSFNDNEFSLDFDTTCSGYFVDSMIPSGDLGILTFSLDTMKHLSVADYYRYSEKSNTYMSVNSVSLDGSVTSYSNIARMDLDDGRSAYFVDGLKNSEVNNTSSEVTDVVYSATLDRVELTAPLSDNDRQINDKALRNISLSSEDIDRDGKLEIPLLGGNGEFEEELSYHDYLISYYEFDFESGTLKKDFTAYVNFEKDYYLTLPDELLTSGFSIAADPVAGEVLFYENGEVFLKVKAMSSTTKSKEKDVNTEIIKLGETQDMIYSGQIFDDKIDKGITVASLREMFSFIEE